MEPVLFLDIQQFLLGHPEIKVFAVVKHCKCSIPGLFKQPGNRDSKKIMSKN